jgi:PAS domain S-box-containing protein
MTPERHDSLERLLEAIPRILKSDSLDHSIIEALELLRRGTGADALVVFLADGDAPLTERWAPDEPATKSLLRPRLKVQALEAIRSGGSHLLLGECQVQNGRATRTVLLCQGEAPLGAVAIAWPTEKAPDDPVSVSWIAAAIELVASTVISKREVSKLLMQAERDKRWFKTLDEHLRVLDRERQKFAAVVNQTDTFVFVTDEERIIRWNNRAMAVLLPFQDDASSWVGTPCSELCARLGQVSDSTHPCDCPIKRALEKNEVTHQELSISVRGAPGVLYLTALPIKGLDGKPREAMILIQDLTGLETLRQSEGRYSVLFERNPEALLIVDPQSLAVLLANPAAQRMLGYTAQEIAQVGLPALHPASEWERLQGFYELASRENAPTKTQCRVLVHDGTERIALVSSARVGLDGKSVDLIEIVDVTSSLQVEQDLGESQARQGAMIEAAPDAIVSMDHAGRILEFNPAAERIFGYRREDVLGQDLANLVIPSDLRDRHRQGIERTMASGDSRMLGRPMEIPALRSDGSSFPIELTIARISSTGAPVFTGFIRDLTERKRAEDALRSAQDRFRTLIQESNLLVFGLDREGVYTVSAGKGLSALGRREGEVVGRSIYDVYHDHPEILASVDRCLAGEEFTAPLEVKGISFEAHFKPERNERGEIVGLFGFASDVTERKQLETQLRHAQKMEAVGRLAGGVAHDFNNLLTVIQGQSEMLLSKMPPRDPARSGAEEIQKAVERGVLLTRQLLAFSSKNVVMPEDLDAGEVVRSMESLLHRLIGPNVRLVTRTGKWPLHVRADRGQLEQVLANLAVNARDAMPQGGNLCIEVSAAEFGEGAKGPSVPSGPYVVLSVSDQGCGMTPEVMSHLFEPFFTTKEQGKGTGLGLSVVYGIVRQSGGDVLVESEPGRGSTFRVCLPRLGGTEPVGEAGPPAAAPAARTGKGTVLLVEDEDSVRALAREFLTLFGYEVVETSSGEEALGVFEKVKETIDVVVTDLIMPGMGGVDLAKRLVVIKPGLKVLLVSGYARDTLEDLEFKSEGFAFLQKPYTMEAFGRRLAELLHAASQGRRG